MMQRSIFMTAVLAAVISMVAVNGQAPRCNSTACQLPDCRCSTPEVPGGLLSSEVPQIILLTFDDAVTIRNYEDFYRPLLFNRKNPNGCPIKATFFNTHEYTNYSLINELYNQGFEMGSHSITHRTGQDFWLNADAETWNKELIGMRNMLEYYGNIPSSQVVGTRAPFLLQGGNEMFDTLSTNGISWDCSWPTRTYMVPGLWPYTLEYASIQDCPIGRCPTNSFPKTWVVPMVDLEDTAGNPCAMLDTCNGGPTNASVYQFLKDNFNTHYESNRSPYGLFLHAGWLQNTVNLQGYTMFLNEMNNYEDVFFLSISQVIDWVKNPTKTEDILNFEPWNCRTAVPPIDCTPVYCSYQPELTPNGDGERVMTICDRDCPPYYPWYDNIEGTIPWRTTTFTGTTGPTTEDTTTP